MHTANYIPKLGLYCVYGGRNDFLPKMQILNDIFILKLHIMEWVQVSPGGEHLPIGRANHSSYVNGTELIICGGQGYDFALLKDTCAIELDQGKISRVNPIMERFAKSVHHKFKEHELEQYKYRGKISKNLSFAP